MCILTNRCLFLRTFYSTGYFLTRFFKISTMHIRISFCLSFILNPNVPFLSIHETQNLVVQESNDKTDYLALKNLIIFFQLWITRSLQYFIPKVAFSLMPSLDTCVVCHMTRTRSIACGIWNHACTHNYLNYSSFKTCWMIRYRFSDN